MTAGAQGRPDADAVPVRETEDEEHLHERVDGPDQVLRHLQDLQTASHVSLQAVQSLRVWLRPPLFSAGHLHRQEQLQILFFVPLQQLGAGRLRLRRQSVHHLAKADVRSALL
jgi:hypothetical protein